MPGFIEGFMHDGKRYAHYIFASDDDRIELQNDKGECLLTHTARCDVITPAGKHVGFWNMQNCLWNFHYNGKVLAYGRDLLAAEVEVSKLYLKGELE